MLWARIADELPSVMLKSRAISSSSVGILLRETVKDQVEIDLSGDCDV